MSFSRKSFESVALDRHRRCAMRGGAIGERRAAGGWGRYPVVVRRFNKNQTDGYTRAWGAGGWEGFRGGSAGFVPAEL